MLQLVKHTLHPDHSGLTQRFNSPPTTFNFIKKMNLTTDQRLALAQRITDEFTLFVKEELAYQIDDMKDNDQLNHEYYITPSDQEDITKLVIDLIAVPVA